MSGDPAYTASQSLPSFPYASYATLIGLDGIRVETPDEIAPAWDRALCAERPFVLEVITDPDVPPLPPHITLDQAKAFSLSVLKGDTRSGGFLKQAVENLFPSVAGSHGD